MPKRRDKVQKKLKPRLHIFCEGEKTEPNYLTGYIEKMFPGTRLSYVRKTKKNTPVQLVDEAVQEKKRSPLGDEFWVVYDREAEIKYPDALHAKARDKADANGVMIALSNVCFEVWILLHFQKTLAVYGNYSDLYNRSKLKTHITNYDKGIRYSFSEDEIRLARENAITLNDSSKEAADPSWNSPHQWNPFTDVYKLLDAIDEFESKHI